MKERIVRGIGCPACGGALEIAEGAIVLNCPYCKSGLMVKGDRGIQRYYVPLKQSKESVLNAVRKWLGGIDKAPGLRKTAEFTESFPVFVPFWHFTADVVGWVLGDDQKGSGKNKKYVPVERRVNKTFEFNCPACDIGELGVKLVNLSGDEILPFDLETVQQQGMTFGILSTPVDLVAACERDFIKQGETSSGVDRVKFSRLHLLRRKLTIIYYPLWVFRYRYNHRIYQVTVDGESGEILYGRAPGNNIYRIAWLIGATALGNFILTSYLRSFTSQDDPKNILGVAIGAAVLIYFGFRKLRYGGEVRKETKLKQGQDIFRKLYGKQEATGESLPQMIQSLFEMKDILKK